MQTNLNQKASIQSKPIQTVSIPNDLKSDGLNSEDLNTDDPNSDINSGSYEARPRPNGCHVIQTITNQMVLIQTI